MGEFQEIFKEIQSQSEIKSAVLLSGKPGSFIAGADIEYAMLQTLDEKN